MDFYFIIICALIVVFTFCFFAVWHYYKARLHNEVNRAMRSEHIKTVFMANVSHALRKPLKSIISDSQMLMHQDVSLMQAEKFNDMIKNINENGKQLMYFISQLLELSNFENGMQVFTMIEVNLAELMASYRREILRDAHPDVSVVVRTALSPHCKGTLDTNLMYQLMMHLLHNAAGNTKEGTITIDYEYENKGLKISIIDTGDGRPQNFQANFSNLIQGAGSLTLFSEGSGLGLSISKAIVDGLNGTIELHAEPGKGTTVDVWLPCKMRDMKKGMIK